MQKKIGRQIRSIIRFKENDEVKKAIPLKLSRGDPLPMVTSPPKGKKRPKKDMPGSVMSSKRLRHPSDFGYKTFFSNQDYHITNARGKGVEHTLFVQPNNFTRRLDPNLNLRAPSF